MNFIRRLWRRLDYWVACALAPEFEATSAETKTRPDHPPHHPRVS